MNDLTEPQAGSIGEIREIILENWQNPKLQEIPGKFPDISLQSQAAQDQLRDHIQDVQVSRFAHHNHLSPLERMEAILEDSLNPKSAFLQKCVKTWYALSYMQGILEIPEDHRNAIREQAQIRVRDQGGYRDWTAQSNGIRQCIEVTQIYLHYLELLTQGLGIPESQARELLGSPENEEYHDIFQIFHGKLLFERTGDLLAISYPKACYRMHKNLDDLRARGIDPAKNRERRNISAYIPLDRRSMRIVNCANQVNVELIMSGRDPEQARQDIEAMNSQEWAWIRFRAFEMTLEDGEFHYATEEDETRIRQDIIEHLDRAHGRPEFMGMDQATNSREDLLTLSEISYFYIIAGSAEMQKPLDEVAKDALKPNTYHRNKIHEYYAFRKDLQRWEAEAQKRAEDS